MRDIQETFISKYYIILLLNATRASYLFSINSKVTFAHFNYLIETLKIFFKIHELP